ncbi:DUF3048 domain-containing protein [Streptomyces sp. NPDC000134]|uniref:DUF3048 domain-containing protein n=1 Tax=Streptomyces sp. NPDC000134 TaxID=3364536 RepID=UPI0036875593
MRREARAVLTAAVAALLAAGGTAGCAAGPGPDDGRGSGHRAQSPSPGPSSREPSRPPSREPAAAARRPAAGPVLAVKVDNVRAARPQAGLDSADVVYVEPVEGGLSRLMALYATRLPASVGPVRSARESDLELLRQFDQPVLAFSGAQRKLLPRIAGAPLRAGTPEENPGAYVRDTARPAPHNLYLRPGELLPSAAGPGALTTGFRHGAAPAGGRPQTSRTVRYPAARFTFTWSADRNRWLVAMDGEPAVTPGGRRLAPATVVVQYVDVRSSALHDFRGNHSPYAETVGSGKAEVLRDGRAHAAAWRRGSAADGTAFTAPDGEPLGFADGQVWVVFADAS